MAITSIMREKLGTDKSLGKITLNEKDGVQDVLRKAVMFMRRNLAKREKEVSEKEIRDVLGYLFNVDGSSLTFQKGFEDKDISKMTSKEEKEAYRMQQRQVSALVHDYNGDSGYRSVDITWTKLVSPDHRGGEQEIAVYIGQPNQFKNEKNGAIYSYRNIDGLSMQINLDRLVSIGALVQVYKEIGVIGQDPVVDAFIRSYFHNTLPQSKSQLRKNFGYRVSYKDFDMPREEYLEKIADANKVLLEGFKRAYRMELNIKSMEDYVKEMGRTVATAFETKKNIPDKILLAMQNSKFLNNKFKFVELDEDTDLEKYKQVEQYYIAIEKSLPMLPVQALRFRKLGKHSIGGSTVSGLFSPNHGSIAVDMRMFDSFIHEYGHAIDFMIEKGEVQSMKFEFTDIINLYEEGLSAEGQMKSYYLTPTEVFARGYEVAFRAKYPSLDTGLIKEGQKLAQSCPHQPFYANKELYDKVIEYMEEYIK